MLDFRVRTFLDLCRTGNYTKTAEQLHITQPAVSQHIKYLEKQLNTRLFAYVGKTLTLTPQGMAFKGIATTMQADADRISSVLAAVKTGKKQVRFGATLTIGEYTMPPLVASYLQDYPDTALAMRVDNTKHLLAALEAGKIDFAFIEGQFDRTRYESLPFSEETYIGVCHPGHPFAARVATFEELVEENIILREKGSGTRDIFETVLHEHSISISSFANITQVGNVSCIKHLVMQGAGVSFLYREAVRKELAAKKICELRLRDFAVRRSFYFVYLKGTAFEREYREFYDYCLRHR